MAWGGGGFGHGGSHGGHGHGPPRPNGLPFGGIPSEMQAGVERLLRAEPDHPEPEVEFSQVPPADQKGFTLGRLLRSQWRAMAVAVALVAVETVALQIGPQLTQRAIDDGMLRGDFAVVSVMAGLYLASVVVQAVASTARVSWTGRLGQRLMYSLRVRVFSHIQRLSVPFFTEERAGRIMTRMTSDIESLSELLGDGIVNLVVQAFTLLYVTIVLFTMDARLALVVTVAVVPVMTVLTLWFRARSEHGYATVRERLADVVVDLQESLSGIRVVAAHNRQRYNEARHATLLADYRQANEETGRVAAIYGPATDGIGTLATALVLGVGGRMVLDGSLRPGELVAFVLYLNAVFAPIQ